MKNHTEETIARLTTEYPTLFICRDKVLSHLLIDFGTGHEWNIKTGQMEDIFQGEKYREVREEKEDEYTSLHHGIMMLERDWYAKHKWRNWGDICERYSPICNIPKNITDDWRTACVEVCQLYLSTSPFLPKMSGATRYDENMDRTFVMEKWHSGSMLRLDKPLIAKALENLLA